MLLCSRVGGGGWPPCLWKGDSIGSESYLVPQVVSGRAAQLSRRKRLVSSSTVAWCARRYLAFRLKMAVEESCGAWARRWAGRWKRAPSLRRGDGVFRCRALYTRLMMPRDVLSRLELPTVSQEKGKMVCSEKPENRRSSCVFFAFLPKWLVFLRVEAIPLLGASSQQPDPSTTMFLRHTVQTWHRYSPRSPARRWPRS